MIKKERFEKAMKSLDEAYAIRDEFANACEILGCKDCSQYQYGTCKLKFKNKPIGYKEIDDFKGLLDFLKDKELPCEKEDKELRGEELIGKLCFVSNNKFHSTQIRKVINCKQNNFIYDIYECENNAHWQNAKQVNLSEIKHLINMNR